MLKSYLSEVETTIGNIEMYWLIDVSALRSRPHKRTEISTTSALLQSGIKISLSTDQTKPFISLPRCCEIDFSACQILHSSPVHVTAPAGTFHLNHDLPPCPRYWRPPHPRSCPRYSCEGRTLLCTFKL
jgi:hypothetical protein